MSHLVWTDDLNTGIDVIDGQHRRIAEYINQLFDARLKKDRAAIGEVIESTVDYTLSHFSFEEALMEDVGYAFTRPHKKVHEIFVRRVGELQMRHRAGDDISEELHGLLARWLFSHIRTDDAAYVRAVEAKMPQLMEPKREEGGWLSRSLGRFFGRR